MRLVHLADIHLGFRQYQRLTPAGINQREADVAAAFARAIDRIIDVAPDIVLIAGDVFHQVRPTNPAIVHAFSQLARLTRALPQADVIMIAGNHDTPRSRDTVCILRLFSQLGIEVIDGGPQRVPLRDGAVQVLCVPDHQDPDLLLTPDPGAACNILLLHGEVEGTLPQSTRAGRARVVVPLSVVANPGWDYVALGHYHVHRQVATRAWYSGAIEYTSTNPWGEWREGQAARLPEDGKGFVEYDLETHKYTFHGLAPSRPLRDLPAIDGHGLSPAELDARIATAVERCKGGIDDRIVRLVLRDVPRHVARDLDHRALREYRRRALQFQLDVRPPQPTRTAASGAPGGTTTLAETLRAHLRDRPLESDLSRDRFVSLGMSYLERAAPDTGLVPVTEDDAR